MKRPQKITLGEMRAMGIRGLLVYCSDYKCSHNVEISADRWPDDVRLSNLEPLFTCQACGLKGAEVRPFGSGKTATAYRNVSWALEPFCIFGVNRFLGPWRCGAMSKRSKSLAQALDAEASQALLQELPSRPEQVAALEEAQRLRTATSTYNYLFSSELKPPD